MDTQSLVELKKLAKPALRHAELVLLARHHSPSKTYNEAVIAGWPKRQASAARSLAQMRRDYPIDFATFTAPSIEQPRLALADAEHAHERIPTMTVQILDSLKHLSDPAAKLRLLIKHGLKEETAALVQRLVSTWQVEFWTDYESIGNTILLDALAAADSSPRSQELREQHAVRVVVRCVSFVEGQPQIAIDFDGLIKHLDWTSDQTRSFVVSVLNVLVKRKPDPAANFRLLNASLALCRKHLTPEDELARSVEKWVLLSRFRNGRIFDLRRTALPVPQPRERGSALMDWQILEELNPIVDRMLEVGMTMQDVRAEFVLWLGNNCKSAGASYQFVLAVAGAKCFRNDLKSCEQRRVILRKHFLPALLEQTSIADVARAYTAFGHFDMKVWLTEDNKFMRPRVVAALAAGNAGSVHQWVLTYGSSFGMVPKSNLYGKPDVGEIMLELAREAVGFAIGQQRFGIAAALSQQYPGCLDVERSRQMVQLALDLEQPIALKWSDAIEKHLRD